MLYRNTSYQIIQIIRKEYLIPNNCKLFVLRTLNSGYDFFEGLVAVVTCNYTTVHKQMTIIK